jgi:carboxymethylenebutenolidase
MMGLNLQHAAKDMSGAVDFLQEKTGHTKVGVVGFCMGGGLTLALACQRPDAVAAAAPFYGVIPWPEAQPNWDALTAVVEGHYAENDAFASPEMAKALEEDLRKRGKTTSVPRCTTLRLRAQHGHAHSHSSARICNWVSSRQQLHRQWQWRAAH